MISHSPSQELPRQGCSDVPQEYDLMKQKSVLWSHRRTTFKIEWTLFAMTVFVPNHFNVKTGFAFIKNTLYEQYVHSLLIKMML